MESANTGKEKDQNRCRCPYCDTECSDIPVVCNTCEVILVECVYCRKPVRENADVCPHCGKTLVSE